MATKNYIKGETFCKLSAILLSSFLITFIFASIFAPVESSGAVTCSSGVTPSGDVCDTDGTNFNVSVHYNPVEYFINVSSTAGTAGTPVSLDYTSASGHALGNVVTDNDTIKTTTNSPLTRQVMLSTTSSSNALENASNDATIPAGGGSALVSASALSDDTWGFAIPSGTSGLPANSFNTSYDMEDITNNSTFTSVPAIDNEIIIQEEVGDPSATSSNQNGNTGQTIYTSTADVYYGVKATSVISSGTYSNTVRYTALAEAPDQIAIHPNTLDYDSVEDPQTLDKNILIYTALASTSEAVASETATVEFYTTTSGAETIVGVCTSPTLNLTDTNFITITCEAPELDAGTYGIKVALTNYGRIVKVDNVFTYAGSLIKVITSCSQLSVDQKGIYNGYEVRKMADNRCWQTSNYVSSVIWENRGTCPSGFTFPTKSDLESLISATSSHAKLYSLGWLGRYWTSTAHSGPYAYYAQIDHTQEYVDFVSKTYPCSVAASSAPNLAMRPLGNDLHFIRKRDTI